MITATGLTKRYGNTTAVDDLTFEITPGIVTGFLGPNGAGKTTTMRLILGLDEPTAGRITVNGTTYRNTPVPIQEIGALIDPNAVHPGRSAYHHLLWQAQSGGIRATRVDDVLQLVGLGDVAGKKVGTYSLGMKQRLGIASALLGDPPVLLFDEPVNGLDPDGIQWMRELMRRFAAEGRTVFISSHLMSEMQLTADHVLVIGRGHLVADVTMAQMIARSGQNHVRIVSTRANDLMPHLQAGGATVANDAAGTLTVTGMEASAAGAIAFAQGIQLTELSIQKASLEAAYMELTYDSVEYRATVQPARKISTFKPRIRGLAAGRIS